MTFIDFLSQTALRNKSALCAGFDPVIATLPRYFKELGNTEQTSADATTKILSAYYAFAIETLASSIACIKPNIAFFEQYGLAGLSALKNLLAIAREHRVPSILDAKRGDIGSTAKAYADAYFTKGDFQADAVTINPFLGFDTVQVFLDAAITHGKGIFVLVKTSNPGSADLQDLRVGNNTISETLAAWIAEHSKHLCGSTPEAKHLSGLGAVVGATHPTHLAALRAAMPESLLLIPGYGAQGGTAADVLPAFTDGHRGAVINASRGLMNAFPNPDAPLEELRSSLQATAQALSAPLIKK